MMFTSRWSFIRSPNAQAVRSLAPMRSQARPPPAIKWASLPSSPALLPHCGRRERYEALIATSSNSEKRRTPIALPFVGRDVGSRRRTRQVTNGRKRSRRSKLLISNPFKDLCSCNAGKTKIVKFHSAEGQIESNLSDLV